MDEGVRVRRAAREAVADVTPPRLGERLDELLADAWTPPGALTLVFARAVASTAEIGTVDERAGGVQLIYEGLRITRRLAREEPWTSREDHAEPNLDILAADVLVSRGFYMLARTEAAEAAVGTVRHFGRDQTRLRNGTAEPAVDRNLEADIFEVAAVAGTTAVGSEPSEAMREYAVDLVTTMETPPDPDPSTLPDSTVGAIADLAGTVVDRTLDEGVRPSTTDP